MTRMRIEHRRDTRLAGFAAALGLSMAVAGGSPASADVIYVDDSAPPPPIGANDGSSWENAFIDLQDALAAAQSGDEIRVGQGAYKPAGPGGPRTATFNLVDGAVVQGGYAGFGAKNPDALDAATFITILSGDLNDDDGPPGTYTNTADNSIHVLFADGVGADTELRGVSVVGGYAFDESNFGDFCPIACGGALHCINAAIVSISDCTFDSNQAYQSGGAIYCPEGATLHLSSCRFTNNQTISTPSSGGGAVAGSGVFIDCVFEHNRTGTPLNIGGGGAVAGEGLFINCRFTDNRSGNGGALTTGGPTTLRDCTFTDNIGEAGGAVSIIGGQLDAINCTFIGNSAFSDFGGAIAAWGSSPAPDASLVNCRFLGNGANTGGALYSQGSLHAANCLFSGNFSEFFGGAVHHESSALTATLVNCTVVGNVAENGAGGIRNFSSTPMELHNCILWDNADQGPQDLSAQIMGAATIANSCLLGWDGSYGGVGNFGFDPLLIDGDGPDNIYGTVDDHAALADGSPCIDSGDAAFLPADEFDLDDDGDTGETLPLDLDGRKRIAGRNVDRGAFEFQSCPADIAPQADQGDGEVNVDDLVGVLLSWGACPQPCPPPLGCAADIVPNCAVDVDDLIAVILGWGACE
jgi:predicted outer membrane repeat protein